MADRGLLRAGAAGAIAGAALLIAATTLHPLDADPGDAAAAFAEYAADHHWVTTHLAQFLGVLLMAVGLFALAETLKKGPRPWLSRLAWECTVASVVAAAVLQAVDGVALKVMVDAWAAAPPGDKAAAFHAALAVRRIEVGAASFMAILFGLTIVTFGVAILGGGIYPRWTGWLAVVGGGGTVAGGAITAHAGFSRAAMTFAMPFNLLDVAWVVAVGVILARRARAADKSTSR